MAVKRLYRLSLIVEVDDESEVEDLASHIEQLACGNAQDSSPEHVCSRGWMIVTEELAGAEADGWRDGLNR